MSRIEPMILRNRGETGDNEVTDCICLNGRRFEASITFAERFGVAGALHGGRISEFLLSEEGVAVGYYNNGEWEIPIPDGDDEAELASLYFLEKFNTKRNMEVP